MLLVIAVLFSIVAKVTLRCPTGYIQGLSDAECYLFVSKPDIWFEAEWTCQTKGGHLASVGNAFESSFFAMQGPDWCSLSYWLGGSNTGAQMQWSWSDETPFSYKNWDKGQPSNSSSMCLAVGTETGFWYSQPCHQPKPFVCKISTMPGVAQSSPAAANCPTTPLPTPLCTTPAAVACPECPPSTCPSGTPAEATTQEPLASHGNYCADGCWSTHITDIRYMGITCNITGSSTVSIHNAQVNAAVADYLKLNNSAQWGIIPLQWSGGWQWIDGSSFDYSNWVLNLTDYSSCDVCGINEDCQPECTALIALEHINDQTWKYQWKTSYIDYITQYAQVCARPPSS